MASAEGHLHENIAHLVKEKQKLVARIRRIRGQVDAIEHSLSAEDDCADVLMLLANLRGGINSLMAEVLEDHICLHMISPQKDSQVSQELAEDQTAPSALTTKTSSWLGFLMAAARQAVSGANLARRPEGEQSGPQHGALTRGSRHAERLALFRRRLDPDAAAAQSRSIREQSVQVRWISMYAWYEDSSLLCASIVSTWGRPSTVYLSIALSQFSRSFAHLPQ